MIFRVKQFEIKQIKKPSIVPINLLKQALRGSGNEMEFTDDSMINYLTKYF